MRSAVLALVLLAASGCAARPDGPPEIVVDTSACSHCGMLISERIYAAAYRVPGSEGRVFDDIGCLIAAARKERTGNARFWFHDGNGTVIEGDAAVFVASPNIKSPMGGGLLAYRDESAAGAAATQYHGEVVRSLADLLNRTGEKP
jgi:copper chaperone NosL